MFNQKDMYRKQSDSEAVSAVEDSEVETMETRYVNSNYISSNLKLLESRPTTPGSPSSIPPLSSSSMPMGLGSTSTISLHLV